MKEVTFKNTTWIAITRPSERDIAELEKRYPSVHQLVLEDITSPTIRLSHVENFDHHLYIVFHFPIFRGKSERTVLFELDFILLPDALITVQYDKIPLLEKLFLECEENRSIREQYGKTPVHLLSYILRQFFNWALKEVDQLQERIDTVERESASGGEKALLAKISILRRNILDFLRSVRPQQLTLDSLLHQGVEMYGEKVKHLLTDVVREYHKVLNLLENHRETLDVLYDTNNQLLASRTNEIMRVFTILAFITFIPTAVANIYGMNIENMPFVDNVNAFWIVIALMSVTTFLVYIALKLRKLV